MPDRRAKQAPVAPSRTADSRADPAGDLAGDPLAGLAPAASPMPAPSESMLVAECIDAHHPTLIGRVLCRIPSPSGENVEQWVPTLMHLPVREGDRVLLARPGNFAEPVVVGVLDGFTPRPERPRVAAAIRPLAPDETVRFESARGEPLVEIAPGASGPVVRLLGADVEIETPGALRVRAGAIELAAKSGSVKIEASDDVVVQGEAIHLN